MTFTFLSAFGLFLAAAESAILLVNDRGDKEVCLSSHNLFRHFHPNTPDLEWDEELAKDAESYAKELARIRDIKHSHKEGVGENLWIQNGGEPGSCGQAVLSWYDEESLYNYKVNRYQQDAGHFTQVVWKGSKKLGVGIAVNEGGNKRTTVIVARYKPAGNVQTQFTINVSKQMPGVKIPSMYDLDPELCKDSYPPSACNSWKKRCGEKLYKSVCPKTCGIC